MNNKQAIKELETLKNKLSDICEVCFESYETDGSNAMTDKLCNKISAIDIAINAIQAIDLLTEGVCGK